MAIHISSAGSIVVIVSLVLPAILAAIVLHSGWLFVAVPFALVLFWTVVGKWAPKKNVTPLQFANQLERHLLGTDGHRGWDDTTSIALADPRLDMLRCKLSKSDLLVLPERRKELAEILAALRHEAIPDVKDDGPNTR